MYRIKQNSDYPPLTATLYQADGTLLSLENATEVLFYMRKKNGPSVIQSGVCEIITVGDIKKIRYQWQSGDTAMPGLYVAEFMVKYGDMIQKVPNSSYSEIEIIRTLEDPVES